MYPHAGHELFPNSALALGLLLRPAR